MKTKIINYQKLSTFLLFTTFILLNSCNTQSGKKKLVFKDYPNLKIGFTTQNFQNAMPINVEGLTEIIEYASKEGYQFIELRDNIASLTIDECKTLAEIAKKNSIDVIYEIHTNPLESGYHEAFERGLANTLIFPGPGIIRTVISKSEFDADQTKKGWTQDELNQIANISDSCALIADLQNVKFIVENFNEPFFGDGLTYFGLTDIFAKTKSTGLQLDMGNPFRGPSREKADPEKVKEYLSSLGNRWVTTHLKTVLVQGGEAQPYLTDNPLPVETVVELMGKQDVIYCSLELTALDDKQKCYDNHATSINYLKDKGVLIK